MSATTPGGAGAAGRTVLTAANQLFEGVRALLGYVSLTATVLSGLALLLKRSFVEAGVTLLAEWIGPFADIIDHARRIVATWDAWVVHPIMEALAVRLDLHPPVWAVEVATLVAFSTGPAIRAVWTARATRRRIHERLARLERLRDELEQRTTELQRLETQRRELQKAIDHKDWNRFKSGLAMAVGVAGGALDILGVLQGRPLGQAARNMHIAVNTWKAGQQNWGYVQTQIDQLGREHAWQEDAVNAMAARIEAMEAADGGLLRGLDDAGPGVADQAIRTFVARQMRIPVAISRFALAFAAAVVAAYAVDWLLLR